MNQIWFGLVWINPKESKTPKKQTTKQTQCLNQSWTSIFGVFCIVSWMPKQKSNVQTALKTFIVLNGFANEENALPQAHHCALPQSLMSLFKIAFQPKIRMGTPVVPQQKPKLRPK